MGNSHSNSPSSNNFNDNRNREGSYHDFDPRIIRSQSHRKIENGGG